MAPACFPLSSLMTQILYKRGKILGTDAHGQTRMKILRICVPLLLSV